MPRWRGRSRSWCPSLALEDPRVPWPAVRAAPAPARACAQARYAAPRPRARPPTLREHLLRLPEQRRSSELVEQVRREVAAVLGLPDGRSIGPQQVLKELGLDSLMAVELPQPAGERDPGESACNFSIRLPHSVGHRRLSPRKGDLVKARSARSLPDKPRRDAEGHRHHQHGLPPPEASTAPSYWDLLAHGGDAIEPFPARWAALDIYDPDPDAKGKSYAREEGSSGS